MLECWSEDPHGRPSFTHLKSKFELMLQLSASDRDQPYIELELDTDQYLYIPDGIEEDDDPNKGVFTKPAASAKDGHQPTAVGVCEKGAASPSAATSLSPFGMGATGGGGGRGGVSLTRIASTNPYIDSPLAADAITEKVCAEETEL